MCGIISVPLAPLKEYKIMALPTMYKTNPIKNRMSKVDPTLRPPLWICKVQTLGDKKIKF